MVEGLGMSSQYGDGNDVELVYEMIRKSVDQIRGGGGPQFLEFETYRWREHCGPNFDNHIGYRPEEEYLTWKERDPITYMENLLMNGNILSKEDISVMEKEIQISVGEAFDFAENSSFPEPEEAFQHLYK